MFLAEKEQREEKEEEILRAIATISKEIEGELKKQK